MSILPAPPSADTIFAPATPAGRSALAVIRVSGPRARHAFEQIAGKLPQPRVAALRTLRHPVSRAALDQALVLFFAAPVTETGEDIVEFQTHGGRAVVAAVLDALATIDGCRLAEPGEFARRAFHNGKLSLTAVEGLADLIDAETEQQRAQALTQAAGALDRLYDGWRTALLEAQGLVEAAIDFADEGDVSSNAVGQATAKVAELAAALKSHLANAHRGEINRSGYKVVLAGPPNAGKSSLLNALARRDAAIVSQEPGTTRDVIEVRLDLGGMAVVVSDTAGIRQAAGPVEQEGIRRTLDRVRDADLVIWLDDGSGSAGTGPEAVPPPGAIVVRSKADLDPTPAGPGGNLRLSTLTGEGLDALTELIVRQARAAVGTTNELAPTSPRHRQHLEATLKAFEQYLAGAPAELEMRAEDLRIAATELGKLVGRIDPEQVLGVIFGRFCIGK